MANSSPDALMLAATMTGMKYDRMKGKMLDTTASKLARREGEFQNAL